MFSDELQHIATPVRVHEWQKALSGHPDQCFASYIISGFCFRIGYIWDKASLQQCSHNMADSDSQAIVSEYLESQLLANRVVKLTDEEAQKMGVHCSPIGVIPKKNRPGHWRLIVDLSSPDGGSVNDGVDKESCIPQWTQSPAQLQHLARVHC